MPYCVQCARGVDSSYIANLEFLCSPECEDSYRAVQVLNGKSLEVCGGVGDGATCATWLEVPDKNCSWMPTQVVRCWVAVPDVSWLPNTSLVGARPWWDEKFSA